LWGPVKCNGSHPGREGDTIGFGKRGSSHTSIKDAPAALLRGGTALNSLIKSGDEDRHNINSWSKPQRHMFGVNHDWSWKIRNLF